MTGFYPVEGSLFGGTLVTIYGNQFIEKEGYNVIQMGYTIDSTVD